MTIGANIRQLRKSAGLTQSELGEKVGVKKNAVSKWECGRVEDIPLSTIKELARLFGVSPSYLIDGGKPYSSETAIPCGILVLESSFQSDLDSMISKSIDQGYRLHCSSACRAFLVSEDCSLSNSEIDTVVNDWDRISDVETRRAKEQPTVPGELSADKEAMHRLINSLSDSQVHRLLQIAKAAFEK